MLIGKRSTRRARSQRILSQHPHRERIALESLEVRRLMAIVVDTTLDETVADSTTSLREAIALAATTAGDDEITFDPTVFDSGSLHTITLSQGELSYASGDGKLTITGPGEDVLAISGASSSRVFNISGTSDVTMTGLTISNGFSTSDGGGILNSATLTLQHVTLSNNIVAGASGSSGSNGIDAIGGGIHNTGTGALTVNFGTFTSNSTQAGNGGNSLTAGGNGGNALGGAIYNEGALDVEDSAFSQNAVQGGNGGLEPVQNAADGGNGGNGFGGAIFLTGSATQQVLRTTFETNVAAAGNGADADSSHTGGKGGFSAGGGIASDADTSLIDHSDFSSNFAFGGGGGSGLTAGSGGGGDGGAIENTGDMTVTGGTFDGNLAFGGASSDFGGDAAGGGIYSDNSLTLSDATLTNNSVTAGTGNNGGNGSGGAIANEGTLLSITNSIIATNSVVGGDGMTSFGGIANGGGIASGGQLEIATTSITGNTAAGGTSASGDTGLGAPIAFGGGVAINGGTADITTSLINDNTATGGTGGDGSNGKGGVGGVAQGGGIYMGVPVALSNSTIYHNTVTGGAGGAGSTTGGAGGIANGGGIYIVDAGSLTATNATIADNAAVGGTGGDPLGATGSAVGGGIFDGTTTSSLTNTLVADNTATSAGADLSGGIVLVNSLVSTPEGDYTTLAGSANNLLDTLADLGTLQDNGGPTFTVLPNTGSMAINHGDDASAIAAFGANGTDQRGTGFDRIVGTVDIGAVEDQTPPTQGDPTISVSGNGNVITNNDTTPSATDFTAFGTQFRYAQPLTRTFVVTNTGGGTLNLSNVTLPAGYTIVEPLSGSLGAGLSDSFTVQLSTQNPGTFAGNIVISSNDAQAATFTFKITGTISSTFKVNFQPQGAPVPDGYVLDAGVVFGSRGNGLSYGWNQSNTGATRDRNLLSDQARDTVVHMQLYGVRTWEISVPNGTYQVHLVSGDAQYFDSVYKVNVEGILTVNGTPNKNNKFIEGTQTVVVTDGKLTITNATGSVNNKLDFVEITPVSTPAVRINFQTSTSPTPAGFLADSGQVFGNRGNGQSYGWNQSASSFSRDRNDALSPDQQHDTLIHTQLYGNRTWELAVANGTYSVHVVAGDPDFIDSVYKIDVEGILTVSGTPSAANHWVEGTKTVTVTDGKLTVTNAAGAVNNKLDYIEVTKL